MSYGNENKLSKKLPVVKKNSILEAKFIVTSLEYKIMMTALSKIRKEDEILKPIEFSLSEFYGLTNEKCEGGLYPYLKRVCERLMSRVVTVKNNDGWVMFNWFHRIKYKKGQGKVLIQFHEDLAPFLLYVVNSNEYTKYLLENILDLDSIYAIRVYELLKQYKTIGKRTIGLQDLREILGITSDKYKKYSDFKRNVLMQSDKEINSKTDLRFYYQEEYEGRKIVSITFFMSSKDKNVVPIDDKLNNLDALPKEQLKLLIRKEIQAKYLVIVNMKIFENLHRFILLNLYKKIIKGGYEKIVVKSPESFFKNQIDMMTDMFDTESMRDF